MSDSLYDALVQTRLRLERGIEDAELDLRDTRDRCARLEGMIRSRRNQPWDAAPQEPAAGRPLVVIPDDLEEPPPTTEASEDVSPESLEVPTSYMPILEELWDIARRGDASG